MVRFEDRCKAVRAAIPVPEFPVHAIRAEAHRKRESSLRKPFAAAIAIAASMAAVAAAATLVTTSHIFFPKSGGIVLSSPDLAQVVPSQIAGAVQRASFPVTLPSGFPPGTRLAKAEAGRDAIVLQYDMPGKWRVSDHVLTFFLMNPQSVKNAAGSQKAEYSLRMGERGRDEVRIWSIGGEAVLAVADNRAVTPAELQRIRDAMMEKARQ